MLFGHLTSSGGREGETDKEGGREEVGDRGVREGGRGGRERGVREEGRGGRERKEGRRKEGRRKEGRRKKEMRKRGG